MNDYFDRADILVAEYFFPGRSAVGAVKYSALYIGSVEMTDCCDEYIVRILRIDRNLSYMLSIVEAEVLPCVNRRLLRAGPSPL